MRYTFAQFWSIDYYVIIFLLIYSASLISMDAPTTKNKINLQLDDGSTYSIEKWKVKKESNTLCECYYSQNKKNPIIIPNITTEEITLFDTSLNKNIGHQQSKSFSKYFKKLTPDKQRVLTIAAGAQLSDGTKKLHALRLTAQLAVQWLDHPVVLNRIIKKYCPKQFNQLFVHLKSCMIIDNITNQSIIQAPAYSYNQDDCLRKISQRGSPIDMPKVKDLNIHNFNGQPSLVLVKNSEQEELPLILLSPKTNHFIVEKKDNEFGIIQGTLEIPAITHGSLINRASLSPDGKWLVTSSYAMIGQQNSKFMLTCLDDSDNDYLSDTIIVPACNFNTAPCFNNASTILASGKPGEVELFSLQKKKVVNTLKLPSGESALSQSWPLELTFNYNDTRLIGCLAHRKFEGHIFMIWDTSNLNNIKELQSIKIPTKRSAEATITFNYPQQNIVAISTQYATFFFDLLSGAFLSKTATQEGKEDENIYAAACSIPHSPIACIATNNGCASSCVKLYNHTTGNCVGTIDFAEPSIRGVGMTNNGRSLITTFDKYKSITTELITDTENIPLVDLSKNMNFVDFYALIQLFRAKKENTSVLNHISQPLYEYIRDFFVENQSFKDIITKYLC